MRLNGSANCAQFCQQIATAYFISITSSMMERAYFGLRVINDLEGIVAKRKFDPYLQGQASWFKIRNRSYSQWEGREELFERERESDPDFSLWGDCALACEDAAVW
jgi:hypothetical protein